jgi:aminoglycoside phosphotransferase
MSPVVFHGCGSWTPTPDEVHKLSVLESKVLSKIITDLTEVTERLRKLHNEKLHNCPLHHHY